MKGRARAGGGRVGARAGRGRGEQGKGARAELMGGKRVVGLQWSERWLMQRRVSGWSVSSTCSLPSMFRLGEGRRGWGCSGVRGGGRRQVQRKDSNSNGLGATSSSHNNLPYIHTMSNPFSLPRSHLPTSPHTSPHLPASPKVGLRLPYYWQIHASQHLPAHSPLFFTPAHTCPHLSPEVGLRLLQPAVQLAKACRLEQLVARHLVPALILGGDLREVLRWCENGVRKV